MVRDEVKNTEISQQDRVKILKHNLEDWRNVLLPINSLLMWERRYDPGILVSVTTSIFLLVWYFEPSVLTTISILGIIICIIDYLVPTLSVNLFDPDKWTVSKERKFEDICRGIVKTWGYFQNLHSSMNYLKDAKPKLYFIVVLLILVMTAWIGNLMDNLLLTYILVTIMMLLPGMKHHGILRQYVTRIVNLIPAAIASVKQKKN